MSLMLSHCTGVKLLLALLFLPALASASCSAQLACTWQKRILQRQSSHAAQL